MAWKKGETGNPNGRPLKNRAWTAILEKAGNRTVDLPDGSKIKRKDLIAELAMQAITNGKVILANGDELELSPRDWMDMLWKVYGQIDGPPRAELDVTSGGEKIVAPAIYLPAVSEDDNGISGS